MWNEIVDSILDDGKDIHSIVGVQLIEKDFVEKEADECRLFVDDTSSENTIKKRNMLFLEQNVDSEENKKDGWSNPTLSNNKELNEEVMNYQSILASLESCSAEQMAHFEFKLDMSFKRIAGYYANYEYRWYEKMGHLFEEPALFYDFFYDLLRDCLAGFNPTKKSNKHERDFRKAKTGVYFNQYFFGALSKRKITNLKKTTNTASNPSILCEICQEQVTRITEYHLRHLYDEARIRKVFKVSPIDINGNRLYEKCPICGEQEVPVSHVKEHSYAEELSVREYIERFPNVPLAGSIRSLQEPLTSSDDGSVLTYEDVYQSTAADCDSETEMAMFSSHIDDVLKDDPFTAEVLKLKMLDYKDNEIAQEIGETCVFEVEYDLSKDIKKKAEVYNYVQSNMNDLDFFKKYNKFHIISRTRENDVEVFHVSSCAPSQVNSALKKLRKNKDKIKALFGDFAVPVV